MPENAELEYIQAREILSNDELIDLIEQVFIPTGFTKFRLTGGEPLLRKGLVSLVQQIGVDLFTMLDYEGLISA
jgi:GTP 3',8-cyclase